MAVAPQPLLVDRFGNDLAPSYRNGYSSHLNGNGVLFPTPADTSYRKPRPRALGDAMQMLPKWQHEALLSDSRQIYASCGGMVKGAIHKKADYVIGNAWAPQYLGEDRTWKKLAESAVYEWSKVCEIRGGPFTWNRCLYLSSVSLDRDGDSLCLLTEDPDGFGTPRLQFIEAHRFGTPDAGCEVTEGEFKGRQIINGIVYDQFLRPIGYNILSPQKDRNTPKYTIVPASSAIHIFDPHWFTQGRGVGSICYSKVDFLDIHGIREATKRAVEINSRLSVIEQNETGTADQTAELLRRRMQGVLPTQEDLMVKEMENGTIRYIKSGGSITSHESKHPNDTWEPFVDHILRGAFIGMDWPIEVAWNMATVGGAAVRAVVHQAQRSVQNRQALLEIFALNMLLHPVSKMIESGELPFIKDWFNWGFTKPARFSVDVGRDRQNAREDLAAGLITMSSSVSEGGDDPEEHMRTRGLDKLHSIIVAEEMQKLLPPELAAKYQITPEDIYDPRSTLAHNQAQQEDPNDEEEKQDAPKRGEKPDEEEE